MRCPDRAKVWSFACGSIESLITVSIPAVSRRLPATITYRTEKIRPSRKRIFPSEASGTAKAAPAARSISVRWNIKTWPSLYVIDAKGVIRFKNVRGEELDQAITDLLAEAGHAVEISHEAQEAEPKKTADPKSTDPAQTNDEAAQKG